MDTSTPIASGLQQYEIADRQKRYGKNTVDKVRDNYVLRLLSGIVLEPMFLVLVAACVLYFVLGKSAEGWMTLAAIVFIALLSAFQEAKSNRAMAALKKMTAPLVRVRRNNIAETIPAEELVPGDIVILEQGNKIPADATVIVQNDLSVDESMLTGESFAVEKNESQGKNELFQGTTITAGRCEAIVITTGNHTKLALIGKSSSAALPEQTLMEKQITRFVRNFSIAGVFAFFTIWILNYLKTGDIIAGLLVGLTLATALIPEEIPVAFASFIALGSYHMSRMGIISRRPQIVEHLGEMSVICLDKTGTITDNSMTIQSVYDVNNDFYTEAPAGTDDQLKRVMFYAMLASEENPFNSMEKAIVSFCPEQQNSRTNYETVKEYPLSGHPPMMTHVYLLNGLVTAAAKGAPEKIIAVCKPEGNAADKINNVLQQMTAKGLRVIAVASAIHEGTFPNNQEEFKWKFEGLLGFYDPPKKNIKTVFKKLYAAGINIKMITGDFEKTAANIAVESGIRSASVQMTGNEVMKCSEKELQQQVKYINVFARMFPEAKLKVVNALKANGNIVGMTGDGVNDAPALHAAHIGIAMGKKGTEMAREAADLILTNDDPAGITAAIEQGRKIFSNFKKAVRYIISIHIPIVMTASLPIILNWKFPNIFFPVHVIFLELIMGPTCSIFFEREQVEDSIMHRPPPLPGKAFLLKKELLVSVLQGLVITIAVLFLYKQTMDAGKSIAYIRTMVFTTLLASNIFLTFVNRSFTASIAKTIYYKNNLALPVMTVSVLFICLINFIAPVRTVFEMDKITTFHFILCICTALLAAGWFEVYKFVRRNATGVPDGDAV